MSQSDLNVANGSGATVRADINAHLDALATLSSGSSAPTTTFANMWWMDTTNNILKQRDNANTAWINVASKSGTTWYPYSGAVVLDAVLQSDISDTLTVGMLGSSYSLGNLNSATTLSISNGNIQHGTMTGSFTLTAPNDTDDGYCEVELTIDATGGYTLTLSGFNEVSGTVDTTANKVNVLRISKLNTNTYLEVIQAV